MASSRPKTRSIQVFARWRPLSQLEAPSGEILHDTLPDGQSLHAVSLKPQPPVRDRPWTSASAFHGVFGPEDDNSKTYDAVVAPNIAKVLRGENCSIFAYGHSGSGKTHTILGYSYEDGQDLGICLAAAKQLFESLQRLNSEGAREKLAIGFSLFELRKKSAFDLLNNHTECHIREGHDGKVHIRGETEVLEGGKVRVRPLAQRLCWTFESLRDQLVQALGNRSAGSSTIHDQSSRTHAVLELEIVNQSLIRAREALLDRQSELVPVGKRAIDIYINEQKKGIVQTEDGKWAPKPDYEIDHNRIDEAEAEKAEFEARVTAAEKVIGSILKSSNVPGLGATMVFVDLAGAEYQEGNTRLQSKKQTPQERQEGRQINSDLLALKEVMRAWSGGQSRIPFRSSTLTMVLREHFMSTTKDNSAIIITVSPAADQYAATLNSLKYASLVGSAIA